MKKSLKIFLIIIVVLLIIPIGIYRLKDGGSTVYKGLIYNITKVHTLSEKSSTGFIDGYKFEIFGLTIYEKLNYHESDKANNKKIGEFEKPITLIIKSGTLTEKGATIVINNGSKITYTFGPEYFIEKKENGIWNEIKLEEPLSWDTVIYTLKPNEKQEINIDFTNGYEKLSNGKYRIGKKVFNKNINMDIYCEFEINDNKEILKLYHSLGVDTALNIDIKREVANISLKEKLVETNWTYYNNGKLKEIIDFISKKYPNIINNKWQYNIHYYDESKENGILIFRYVINKDILTNKAVTCTIENGKITIISYTNINEKVDENTIINNKRMFENNTIQEKKELKKNEEYIKEDVVYEYNYNLGKLIYGYNLFYYEIFDNEKVINNSTVSSYFVDDIIESKNIKI